MKLSIIVPVFNVATYLPSCIESIINQTLRDFELILVDDGSTDNSKDICDKYAKVDKRINVIHKENEGQAIARNEGLKVAQGEFIGFVDGDDTVLPSMYEDMINVLETNDADIAVCGIENIDEEGNILENWQNIESDSVFLCEDILNAFYDRFYRQLRGSVCNKVYKKYIFDHIKFPESILYEDSFVLIDTIKMAKRITFLKKNYYIYLSTRSDSTMHYKYSEKSLHSLLFHERNYLFFVKFGLRSQINCALEEYLNDYLRHLFMIKTKHMELSDKLSVKIPFFKMLFNRKICRLKKLVLILSFLDTDYAIKICKQYFPECVHKYLFEKT